MELKEVYELAIKQIENEIVATDEKILNARKEKDCLVAKLKRYKYEILTDKEKFLEKYPRLGNNPLFWMQKSENECVVEVQRLIRQDDREDDRGHQ